MIFWHNCDFERKKEIQHFQYFLYLITCKFYRYCCFGCSICYSILEENLGYNLCTWIWMALLHIYDEVFHEIPRNVYPVDQSQRQPDPVD